MICQIFFVPISTLKFSVSLPRGTPIRVMSDLHYLYVHIPVTPQNRQSNCLDSTLVKIVSNYLQTVLYSLLLYPRISSDMLPFVNLLLLQANSCAFESLPTPSFPNYSIREECKLMLSFFPLSSCFLAYHWHLIKEKPNKPNTSGSRCGKNHAQSPKSPSHG